MEQRITAIGGDDIVLQDVTSHSLGVRTENDRFSIILPKEARIPGEKTEHYTNAGPATELAVQVFQGEQESAIDNEFIGSVPITFPEPRERGYWDLAVTFGLDVDGLLHAKVHCVNNGSSWEADLRCSVRTSRDEIEKSASTLQVEMAGLPRPPAEEPPQQAVPAPPEKTPAEHKVAARRSYRILDDLDPEPRARLLAAYLAFVAAVEKGTPDVDDLGDTLFDVYAEVRQA